VGKIGLLGRENCFQVSFTSHAVRAIASGILGLIYHLQSDDPGRDSVTVHIELM